MGNYTNRLQVSVSDKLYTKLKDRAEYSGATLPEYVRYVLMKEMEKEYEEVVSDQKLANTIKEGIEEYKKGKTNKFDNVQEAIDYLDEYVKKGE